MQFSLNNSTMSTSFLPSFLPCCFSYFLSFFLWCYCKWYLKIYIFKFQLFIASIQKYHWFFFFNGALHAKWYGILSTFSISVLSLWIMFIGYFLSDSLTIVSYLILILMIILSCQAVFLFLCLIVLWWKTDILWWKTEVFHVWNVYTLSSASYSGVSFNIFSIWIRFSVIAAMVTLNKYQISNFCSDSCV